MFKGKTKPKPYSLVRTRRFARTLPPSITEINYDQMKKFIESKSAWIIDVRSRLELTLSGVFPNSHHIQISEINFAFNLTSDKFLGEYKFPKPNKNDNIVFACAHGVRSLVACYYLDMKGYKKLFNYTEGWIGWNNHIQNETTT